MWKGLGIIAGGLCISRAEWFRKKLISQAFWLAGSELSFDIKQSNCSNLGNQFWEISFYEIN